MPPELRAEVWWSILGCQAKQSQSPGIFQTYLSQALEPKSAEVIERDLPRTFPGHRSFRTSAGRQQLRRVLHAFAHHSPRIAYCQGLNFIAGLLLVVFNDEEKTFWALVSAFESLGLEGYYTEGMTLLRADMEVLSVCLRSKCPKVSQIFASEGIDLTSICSEWFLTWFAKSLPAITVLRVWDALFFEGFKVLFRVALGLFRMVEADILKTPSFEEIMGNVKTWSRKLIQHNELLKVSFQGLGSFPRRTLYEARARSLTRIEAEDQDRIQRAKAREQAAAEARQKQALGSPGPAVAVSPNPRVSSVSSSESVIAL